MIGNFEAARTFLNWEQLCEQSLSDMYNLFFIDYNLMPLLIQENYLSNMN